MSDDIDRANDSSQTMLDAKLADIHNHQPKIEGDGNCLSCGAKVEPVSVCGKIITGRFCCIECRDIWELEQ
jgi:hypothetical protein